MNLKNSVLKYKDKQYLGSPKMSIPEHGLQWYQNGCHGIQHALGSHCYLPSPQVRKKGSFILFPLVRNGPSVGLLGKQCSIRESPMLGYRPNTGLRIFTGQHKSQLHQSLPHLFSSLHHHASSPSSPTPPYTWMPLLPPSMPPSLHCLSVQVIAILWNMVPVLELAWHRLVLV